MNIKNYIICLFSFSLFFCNAAYAQQQRVMGDPVDLTNDFLNSDNTFFLADKLDEFDPQTASGKLGWQRSMLTTAMSFDNMTLCFKDIEQNEWPPAEYEANPSYVFDIDFISPRTIRLRAKTDISAFADDSESMMLINPKLPTDSSWKTEKIKGGYRYSNISGSVSVYLDPWRIELRDPDGKLITETIQKKNELRSFTNPMPPFAFIRRANDYSRSIGAAFSLSYNEKIFGCGESFTNFDKRGQKINLYTTDGMGTQSHKLYKPVPFFMSNRGYGMFIHTTTPITCDFGSKFQAVNNILIGDNNLDIFIFLGEPKDILNEYTNLTGKPAMPPLWSFGLWMSCITYSSEQETREVAAKLRKYKIPSDVIHLDTGWFETDWRCDYEFSKSRFDDPAKMISDLKQQGFHISLWQLPYFVPNNIYYNEIIEKGLYVKGFDGGVAFEDVILDFSNPDTIKWYQDKIAGLLKLGVGVIKVDFGESGPYKGIYASGKTGFYEHNLYPLRYNKTMAEITRQITGDTIIWARSAWAGSQRYPLHWGGDNENTDTAMAASLRGGLSFGLSGFSFWSHDIGGFVQSPSEEMYRRWMPFGMLTSHSRSHGSRPREPWDKKFSDKFLDDFRQASAMKYKLMPYVYAQAKHCVENGLPMMRALFVEYPSDPGSWLIDNEYLFGSDILVAPLFEEGSIGREVYLPAGNSWVDYQTGKEYQGGTWYNIAAGEIPIVMLVKSGTALPHVKPAQCTSEIDWTNIELIKYGTAESYDTKLCLPEDNVLHTVSISGSKVQSTPALDSSIKLILK